MSHTSPTGLLFNPGHWKRWLEKCTRLWTISPKGWSSYMISGKSTGISAHRIVEPFLATKLIHCFVFSEDVCLENCRFRTHNSGYLASFSDDTLWQGKALLSRPRVDPGPARL